MKDQIIKFWRDEEGATAIEYGQIAGLIGVALVAALTTLGGNLTTADSNPKCNTRGFNE